MTVTIQQTLRETTRMLATAGQDSARLDAELLLAHVLQVERSYLYAWPERDLAPEQAHAFRQLVELRATGHPVAHLLGRREFYALELQVTPQTLIPRPETEGLVDRVLEEVPADADLRIADLGTGSGAIALAIASHRPRCEVVATDASLPALQVAQENARRLGLKNVHFLHSDWCKSLRGNFDLVVSNPPYVSDTDQHLLAGDVRFEPMSALQSGNDGLDDIRRLCQCCPRYLRAGGRLLLEHGIDQGQAVRLCLQDNGFIDAATWQDLSGRDRYSGGRLPV